jgi:adenosylcobinamide amidohydrolase
MQLTDNIILDKTDKHMHLLLRLPQQVVSSAVLNGGQCQAKHVVNMYIPESPYSQDTESPHITLQKYCSNNGWQGTSVGMMTSAPMDSFRIAKREIEGIKIAVMLTSGLNNARRAGDVAEHRSIGCMPVETGTINIIALTTARLSPAAAIEAIQIITEAKTTVLQDFNIHSPVSNRIATGTGTDALALINGDGPSEIHYCGKHVLFGEILAQLVIESLSSSLSC